MLHCARSIPSLVLLALLAADARGAESVFDYRVERFVVGGQVAFADEFDDGSLVPWNPAVGTVVETGAELSLRSPGVFMPDFWDFVTGSRVSPGIDVSNAVLGAFQVSSGSGDFVAASVWTTLPTAPVGTVGGFYAMSIQMPGAPQPGECIHPPNPTQAPVAVRTFTVAMRDFNVVPAPYVGPTGLAMGLNETVVCVFDPLDPSQNEMDSHSPEAAAVVVPVTGNVVLRMSWDDTAGEMTPSYSVDGGGSFQTPFAPRAVSFTNASFQLLGDPVLAPQVPATTVAGRLLLAFAVVGLAAFARLGWTRRHRAAGS